MKSVPVENFKRPVRKELPPDFDPEQAFPDTLYFKDAELGKNVMHKMKPTDKVNLNKMCRHYRCAHYRSFKCGAKLCVEISGTRVDYIHTGEHHAECTRKNAVNAHNIDTLGEDYIAGLPLDERCHEMAKELAMSNLSWPAMRIYQHVRNILLPGRTDAARFPTDQVVSCILFICILFD